MKKYLQSSTYIDWLQTEVSAKAKELSEGLNSDEEIAESCFLFVRDEIKHS